MSEKEYVKSRIEIVRDIYAECQFCTEAGSTLTEYPIAYKYEGKFYCPAHIGRAIEKDTDKTQRKIKDGWLKDFRRVINV